jgi:hypothetical protein
MSLENWVKNSWLERLASDSAEIARLLGIADSRLEDYQKAVAGKLSPDVQLNLAYDAIRASATAALRAAGYRVVEAAANTTEPSRLSSFRSMRRRNSFRRSISCVKSGTPDRMMISG